MENILQLGPGSASDNIVLFRNNFDILGAHPHITQLQCVRGGAQEGGFALIALDQRDLPLRHQDSQNETRQPCPAAHIQHRFCILWNMWNKLC